jgi:hypothetical protein
MLTAQPVFASSCITPADAAALKIASLKSELMVTALTCMDSDRYNQFMAKFKTDLVGNENNLQAYFARAYGHMGQKQHDDYITSLANSVSTAGLSEGTALCVQNEPMFDEVLALPSGNDLPDYAAGKNLAQPLVAVSCSDLPPAVTRKITLARSKTRTTHHASKV